MGSAENRAAGTKQPWGKLRVTGDNINRKNSQLLKITTTANTVRSFRIYIPETIDYKIT